MEIHSSSRASIPATSKNNNDLVLSNSSKNHSNTQSTLSLPSPNTVEINFNKTDLQQLSDIIDSQNKTLGSNRSDRAINSYIKENIQTLKNQRSALISSIDIFA